MYEYTVLRMPRQDAMPDQDQDYVDRLNEKGIEGWLLVNVLISKSGNTEILPGELKSKKPRSLNGGDGNHTDFPMRSPVFLLRPRTTTVGAPKAAGSSTLTQGRRCSAFRTRPPFRTIASSSCRLPTQLLKGAGILRFHRFITTHPVMVISSSPRAAAAMTFGVQL